MKKGWGWEKKKTLAYIIPFLSFNSTVAGGWGEGNQQCLPLTELLTGSPRRREILPLIYMVWGIPGRALCHSIPTSIVRLALRSLHRPTQACNCQKAFPKSINTAGCQICTLLLYRLQIFQSLYRSAASVEQTRKKTHEMWWLYLPFQYKRNKHTCPAFLFQIFTGRLEKQQMTAIVSA